MSACSSRQQQASVVFVTVMVVVIVLDCDSYEVERHL